MWSISYGSIYYYIIWIYNLYGIINTLINSNKRTNIQPIMIWNCHFCMIILYIFIEFNIVEWNYGIRNTVIQEYRIPIWLHMGFVICYISYLVYQIMYMIRIIWYQVYDHFRTQCNHPQNIEAVIVIQNNIRPLQTIIFTKITS